MPKHLNLLVLNVQITVNPVTIMEHTELEIETTVVFVLLDSKSITFQEIVMVNLFHTI
jgi:hypothetical protein